MQYFGPRQALSCNSCSQGQRNDFWAGHSLGLHDTILLPWASHSLFRQSNQYGVCLAKAVSLKRACNSSWAGFNMPCGRHANCSHNVQPCWTAPEPQARRPGPCCPWPTWWPPATASYQGAEAALASLLTSLQSTAFTMACDFNSPSRAVSATASAPSSSTTFSSVAL